MQILDYFPERMGQVIQNKWNRVKETSLEEIRIRVNRPIILKGRDRKSVV